MRNKDRSQQRPSRVRIGHRFYRVYFDHQGTQRFAGKVATAAATSAAWIAYCEGRITVHQYSKISAPGYSVCGFLDCLGSAALNPWVRNHRIINPLWR